MNCRRIEELIPLYVGRDLEPGRAEKVALHLGGCSRCGQLAAAYKESQDWLRSSDVPGFSEAELGEMRAGLFREIERQKVRPGLLELISRAWSARRLAFATAALLVLFGALAFYLYSAGPAPAPEIAGIEKPDSSREKEGQPVIAHREDPNPAPGANSVPSVRRRHYAKRGAARIKARPAESVQQASAAAVEVVNPPLPAGARPDGVTGSVGLLRIEIQTSDPNIRIIWFAPKETDSPRSTPMADNNEEALCID
jgi:hypothetical protein